MPKLYWLVLCLLFAFRLLHGVCANFWRDDELQVYLIGLKYATTGEWPYYGPDIAYRRAQIPGALQGLAVGMPIRLFGFPEAPCIVLNVASFGALVFFVWYLHRRFPAIPLWFTGVSLFTAPWLLFFSTHVINPSYVMPFAILFFTGFFDLFLFGDQPLLAPAFSLFLMGLSLGCIMQLHMSWVILVPAAGVAVVAAWRHAASRAKAYAAGLVGLLLGISLIVPTWLNTAHPAGGQIAKTVVFRPSNLLLSVHLIARFLSFGSYELTPFIGGSTHARLAFLAHYWWAIPFAAFMFIVSVAQPLWYLANLFRRLSRPEWDRVRMMTIGLLLLLIVSFAFSVRGPQSHTFCVTLPVAIYLSFCCLEPLFAERRWRVVAAATLVAGLVVQTAIVLDNFENHSLYLDRARVVRAIAEHDYHFVGIRRAEKWGCCY